METPEEPAAEAVEPVELDAVAGILNELARMSPDSLPVNFITLVEWLEPDGSGSFGFISTPMSPWLCEGMLKYALDNGPALDFGVVHECDFEFDDEDYEE